MYPSLTGGKKKRAEKMNREGVGRIGRPKTLSLSYIPDGKSHGRQLSVSN